MPKQQELDNMHRAEVYIDTKTAKKFFLKFLKDEGIYIDYLVALKNSERINPFDVANFSKIISLTDLMTVLNYSFTWSETERGSKFWLEKSVKFAKMAIERFC